MVDLSAPPQRKQSVSSLRQYPPDMHMIAPWTSSSTNLSLPGAGTRVGLPDRPSTAGGRTKEWVNPLDVHFSKETLSSSIHKSHEAATRSPLSQSEASTEKPGSVDRNLLGKDIIISTTVHTSEMNNGYPSPPPSVSNGDQCLSPGPADATTLSTKNNSPAIPSSLPSPATSAARSSEDRWEAPVVRNVLARRDTATFHSPRRRSFTMDIEAKPEELKKMRKQQQTEGFAGNFADFDFGETVKRQTTIDFPIPDSMTNKSELREDFKFPALDLSQFPKVTQGRKDATKKEVESSSAQSHEPSKLPPLGPPPRSDIPARPVTSYGPSDRVKTSNTSTSATHKGTFVGSLDLAVPPGFHSRFDLDKDTKPKTAPPRPLRPALPIDAKHSENSPKSPFAPSPSMKSLKSPDDAPRPSVDHSPGSPFTQAPMEGAFPKTKGLPRGRQPPRRPPRSDEATNQNLGANKPDFAVPNWGLDKSEPRRSAMPAPLAPLSPPRQPRPSTSSTMTTATAPRIPSPTFTSLEISLSDATDSLAMAFEEAFEKSAASAGFSGDFFSTDQRPATAMPLGNSTRIETATAPPRPPPMNFSSSSDKSQVPAVRPAPLPPSDYQAGFF